MARYFFHLHECEQGVKIDHEGKEAGDIEAARAWAVDLARAAMANEVAMGKLCLSCWIVIADASGHNLMTLHFGEAITLVNEPSHCASYDSVIPHQPA